MFSADVGDAWNIHSEALALFLTTLFTHRQQVVILSGDIHYGAAMRLSYAPSSPSTPPKVLVQLVASAFKNEEPITRLIHTRLKDLLLPEPVRRWWGWSEPMDMEEQSGHSANGDRLHSAPPDWVCVLEWLARQTARPAIHGANVPWLLPSHPQARRVPAQWVRPLLIWRWRWWQEGREVVGLNNMGLVQFDPETGDRPLTLIQDLYWFSPWFPIQSVYSRYQCPLVPNLRHLS